MFNIKRASHRNVVALQILAEKQLNTLETPPLPDKALRRFPSARMSRVKYQQVAQVQSRQLKNNSTDLSSELKSHQEKLQEKARLEESIPRLCMNYLCERPPQIRSMRDTLITKVKRIVSKNLNDKKLNEEEYEHYLLEIIEAEASKISRSKYCADKYEDCVSKIQKMLDNRLSGL